jgi:putative inorganic carbon (hco3(-)) transporter
VTGKKLINTHLDLIGWQLIALVVLVPLVLWPKTSEVFEFNKMLITYLLSATTFLTFLSLCNISGKNLFRRTPLDIPIAAFLLSQLVSTVLSIHPSTSIWGYYSRFHGGLLSYICYALFYYLFVSYSHLLSDDKKDQAFFTRTKFINFFIQSLTLTGGLAAFYGVLEHFGIDKHIWIQDVQSRVFSTLGQPNWLSAYLVALMPISLHLFTKSKDTKQKTYWLVLTLLYLVAILFTKSRSGIGTSVVVLGLHFFYNTLKTLKSKKTKTLNSLAIFSIPVLLAIIIIGTPWSPTPNEFKHRLDVGGPLLSEVEPYLNKVGLSTQLKPLDMSKLPKETQDLITQRSKGIRVGGSDSFQIRQVVWQGATDLFKRRPIFGTGVETFGYSYYWVRPIAHNTLSEWDFLYNKAHNEYLNFLATTGSVGLFAYLLLLLGILKILWSNPNKSKLGFPLVLSFLSILLTNYFGFSVVIIGIFLFLFPAIVLYAKSDEPSTTIKPLVVVSSGIYFATSFYFFMSLIVGLSIYRIWTADIHYSIGRTYLDLGYVAQSIQDLEKATSLSKSEGNYQTSLAEAYATAALALHQKSISATQSAGLSTSRTLQSQSSVFQAKAADSIQKAVESNPYHLNYLKSKVKIEIILSDIDKRYLNASLQTLNQAITLAPTDPKLVYNLGLIYEQLGQKEQAKQAYEKALDLKPDYQSVKEDLDRITKAMAGEQAK